MKKEQEIKYGEKNEREIRLLMVGGSLIREHRILFE